LKPTSKPTATASSAAIEISVIGGSLNLPYYDFTIGGNPIDSTYEFIRGLRYKFVKPIPENTHPFFISNQGPLTASTFPITSTATFNTGITAGGSLEFQIPSNFVGDLTYYCVLHASIMVKTFTISSTTTTTSKPTTRKPTTRKPTTRKPTPKPVL
jgi:hypothetical protein